MSVSLVEEISLIKIRTISEDYRFEHIAYNGWALKISSKFIGRYFSDDDTIEYIKNVKEIVSIKFETLKNNKIEKNDIRIRRL